MLRLPPFTYHRPKTAAEAVRIASEHGKEAMYVAGGTDLLPNLKHRLHRPAHLVSLQGLDELVGIEALEGGGFRIGAGTSLQAVADGVPIAALATAAGAIAGPQHRRMGTLGGNVMLDTRCLFYNQSEEWRRALDFCLKKDGDFCHVLGSPASCVAAQSSDTVPVLIALGATLEVEGPDGPAELLLEDLFTTDGRFDRRVTLAPGALVTAIRIGPHRGRSVYRKVRARGAVDFPQLGVAVVGELDGDVVRSLDVVVGAILPKPKRIRKLDVMVGQPLDVEAVADQVFRQVKPQRSIHGDAAWRRHMARVETRRALETLRRQPT